MAKLMIIDDTDGTVDDVADKLCQLGHEVEIQGPSEALEGGITSSGVDAVLLNMGLKETTGWNVLTLMKIQNPEIPVCFIFHQASDLHDERLHLVDCIINRAELELPELVEMTRILLQRIFRMKYTGADAASADIDPPRPTTIGGEEAVA